MQSGSRFFGYHITTDPTFQNKRFGITEDLANEFEKLHSAALNKGNQKIIQRLTNLILEYPKVPQLKNFLSVAYNVRGNYEKAIEINKWILSEHPDYLFAKINAAHEHITKGAAEKVPQILGEYLEIQALYPERDMFHLSEVTAFNKLIVRYYAAIDDQEMAHNRMKILEEIAPDHPDTRAAGEFLFPLEWIEIMKHAKDQQTKTKGGAPQPTRHSAPAFKHAQINLLYRYGIRIPQEIIRDILGLDRESVIKDLEKVLDDAMARSEYFMVSEAAEVTTSFPLHAISLLAELKATNSLRAILKFLEGPEEELDFWLGDHLSTTVWMHLFSLSQTQGQLLKDFLLIPGVNTFSRTAATQALAQTAIHFPAKRSEIELIFKEVLSFYNQAEMLDDVVDIDFVGLLIADIVDCGFTQLLPEIESLFKKDRVDLGMNGSFADVETAMHNPAERAKPIKIQDIFELYTNVLNTWAGYSEVDDFDDSDVLHNAKTRKPASAMPVVSLKTGRNDLCPCGSGKKYKKCCMGK